jgi:hypothetical protein
VSYLPAGAVEALAYFADFTAAIGGSANGQSVSQSVTDQWRINDRSVTSNGMPSTLSPSLSS